MRTGTRCTTLIQLPVAFCAGIAGEGRTRAAGQARHHAVIGHRAAVQIGADLHGLADAHALELAFLEVRVDMHLAERHDRPVPARRPGSAGPPAPSAWRTTPSTGARITVRSRFTCAWSRRARASATSGLVSSVALSISTALALRAPTRGRVVRARLRQRCLGAFEGIARLGQLVAGHRTRVREVLAALAGRCVARSRSALARFSSCGAGRESARPGWRRWPHSRARGAARGPVRLRPAPAPGAHPCRRAPRSTSPLCT